MAEEPITVIHGDMRCDNFLFGARPEDEPLIAVDWQGSLRGRAAQDLGYFLSGSLTVADRSANAHALIAAWHEELTSSGIGNYTLDDAWLDYRRGSLLVWTHAVVIAGTLDHTNERGHQWVHEMLVRCVAAFDELDLIGLLAELE
jgi:thiamine kinase-like enzyme